MANENDNTRPRPDTDRLPIKVVLPKQGSERRVTGGGSKPEPFQLVDSSFRENLVGRIETTRESFTPISDQLNVAPARVQLVPRALAKTHRPERLFSPTTCPIIGAGKPAELFVRIGEPGLNELKRLIVRETSPQFVKEISSIETIEPITPDFRLGGITPLDILREAPRKEGRYVIQVQLFDIGLKEGQPILEQDFQSRSESEGLLINQVGYGENSRYFAVMCRNSEEVDFLSNIVSIRSIKQMPVMRLSQPGGTVRRPFNGNLPTPTVPLESLPAVAVVDSGLRRDVPELEAWVIHRASSVALEYRNEYHGTFVGALVTFGPILNPLLQGMGNDPCAVYDFQIIPNDDTDAGQTGDLLESEFLETLEGWLRQYSNEIRVWNLSLGTDDPCKLDSFSSLAVALDRFQEEYNVSFVISAGNYNDTPLLNYPRSPSQIENGRITVPADSALAITVGSAAHTTLDTTGPNDGEPSPFSRHGAGPNYIIKPDLLHYGGTIRPDGTEPRGIESIVDAGTIGDDCGTSYSTPLVSRILANIYHQVVPTPSRELARAILTHHARDPRNGGRVPDNEENFIGFGLPSPTPLCIQCDPWTSTLVFEDTLRPGFFLEWDNFPFPPSLTEEARYSGESRYRGDIWMTLAFTPTRNPDWGSEYCESHINASFGVYHRSRNRQTGRFSDLGFKGLVPPEHKNAGTLWESVQVANLRKWAPVRTYYGSLGPSGILGERWRLMLRPLFRHGIDELDSSLPQRFALIITIADPSRSANVYDEMAVSIRTRLQTQNLTLRSVVQVRSTP